jgi:biotin synthase-related radical SAM superfamily protein
MTEYTKINLFRAITDNGSVEITVVPNDEANELIREITYTNYEEALADITGLEYENEIYF